MDGIAVGCVAVLVRQRDTAHHSAAEKHWRKRTLKITKSVVMTLSTALSTAASIATLRE